MKVEVKKIDATKRELRFEVSKDRLAKTMEEIYTDVGKDAKIKGFRPGKVPRHLLEAQYGKSVQEEAIKKLIPEIYHEGLEQEKLSPVDLPEIFDVSLKDGILSFTAKLDVKPEVKIKDYKGIKISRKNSQVSDEEINKTLEFFQKGQGKDTEVHLDDAFARGLGYPDLESFKASLRRQLEVEKDRQNRHDVENQIVEHLMHNASLTIPQSVVDKQLTHRYHETKERLLKQGVKEEEVTKREQEIKNDLRKSIEKDIRLYFILDKIAELENIPIEKNEHLVPRVMEFLLKEAQWSNE